MGREKVRKEWRIKKINGYLTIYLVNFTLYIVPRIMVELQSIFKKAYWSLAAGGFIYVLFIYSLTFPVVQRLYESLSPHEDR